MRTRSYLAAVQLPGDMLLNMCQVVFIINLLWNGEKWQKNDICLSLYQSVCAHDLIHTQISPAYFQEKQCCSTPSSNKCKTKSHFTVLFDSHTISPLFWAFFFLSLTQPRAAVLYYNSIPMHATHLPVHAYTCISQQWRSNTLSSLISEAALL